MSRSALSVSDLIQRVNRTLSRQVQHVFVRGELSGVRRASSGHIYFRLKDDKSVLDAAFFRHRAASLDYSLRDGLEVVVQGSLTIFPPQGRIQLVVEELDLVGVGALSIALEKMMNRLSREGLFAPEHKKPLPVFPRRIALITSPTGAALHDLLTVLERRSPSCSILVAACQVQGVAAAPKIVQMIEAVNRQPEVDLIILGRGGGSMEDLWPFNEEIVARAIFASEIPILTGIGHETDFTIADFVADKRAPTPSAAAELAVPEEEEWRLNLQSMEHRLVQRMYRVVEGYALRLSVLRRQLQPPQHKLALQRRQLEHFVRDMEKLIRRRLQQDRLRLKQQVTTMEGHNPLTALAKLRQRWVALSHQLRHGMDSLLQRENHRLARLGQRLNDLSPLTILERGYALAYDESGRVLRDASKVEPGDAIRVRLEKGSLRAEVQATEE